MEEAASRLTDILARSAALGVCVPSLPAAQRLLNRTRPPHRCRSLLYFFGGVLSATLALAYSLQLHTHAGLARAILRWNGYDLFNEKCALTVPDRLTSWVRPAEDCSMCEGHNISPVISCYPECLFQCALPVPDRLTSWVRPAEDCSMCEGHNISPVISCYPECLFQCALPVPDRLTSWVRPAEDCSMCEGHNISPVISCYPECLFQCALPVPDRLTSWVRPAEDCSMCEGHNISPVISCYPECMFQCALTVPDRLTSWVRPAEDCSMCEGHNISPVISCYPECLFQCALTVPDRLTSWVRPAEDCSMCEGLTQVDTVANISPHEFEEKYAYSGRPVVVRDGTSDWPGRQLISFKFFQQLYNNSLDQMACQFFPYESGFASLREVLSMEEARAEMRDGTEPWYIGWSNCDNQVARVLKEQYSRPYFLPETSENKKVDWIFMGSPGYGAKMHVDSVSHPSWQAQLRGRKKWTLQPPPECIYHCNTLEVIVNPGEIIVLDTNRWYHQTLILPGEMSVTIGAEYD